VKRLEVISNFMALLRAEVANIAKQEASSIIDQGTDLLNDKMDKMMLQFKQSNLTFYDSYQSARMIVN
jgi:hypothetical protein